MIDNETVNKAIDYIMNHISEDIGVEDVAEYCHFSKYHFSRMFKEATGESIYSFIKRVKMEQSAFRLKVEKTKSVTDICTEYGYSSSNYSSAFKQYHHVSPAVFRKTIYDKSVEENPNWEEYSDMVKESLLSFEECADNITMEEFEDFFVIYERHKGNYQDMRNTWCAFIDRYSEYFHEDSILLESTYDDPSITDVNGCMYDLCVTVEKDCPVENTRILAGGKYAVFHFKGYLWEIYPVHQSILGIWFPKSGYEIDSRYGFDIYRAISDDSTYMEIDMCIPVK